MEHFAEEKTLKKDVYSSKVELNDDYITKCRYEEVVPNYDDYKDAFSACRNAINQINKKIIEELEREKIEKIHRLTGTSYAYSKIGEEDIKKHEEKLEERKDQLTFEIENFNTMQFQGEVKFKDMYELWQWGFNRDGIPVLTYGGYELVKTDNTSQSLAREPHEMYREAKKEDREINFNQYRLIRGFYNL